MFDQYSFHLQNNWFGGNDKPIGECGCEDKFKWNMEDLQCVPISTCGANSFDCFIMIISIILSIIVILSLLSCVFCIDPKTLNQKQGISHSPTSGGQEWGKTKSRGTKNGNSRQFQKKYPEQKIYASSKFDFSNDKAQVLPKRIHIRPSNAYLTPTRVTLPNMIPHSDP